MAKKSAARKRQKNPSPATSAWLGSIVGTTVGGLVGYPFGRNVALPLAYLGGIAGAGVGGHLGAPDDRKQRTAIGGVVGEAIFPLFGIGAAVGGHYGAKKPDARKGNPSALAIAGVVVAGAAAATLGYYGYKKLRPRLGPSKTADVEAALEGVYDEGATLREAPLMLADIRQPIALTTGDAAQGFDRVADFRVAVPHQVTTGEPMAFGTTEPASALFGSPGENQVTLTYDDGATNVVQQPDKAIGFLVTNLEPGLARTAYELALHHIVNKGVMWSDGTQRDAATKSILKAIAPKVDWSKGLDPYTFGSVPYTVWASVQTIGTVAAQSLANKQAA